MSSNETCTISDLAAQLDLSPSTIRYYEDRGLISPGRTPGNQRVYTKKDRARLKLIIRGKRFGASLEEIAAMIGMADAEINEMSQIDISLTYINEKFKEIEEHKRELALLEEDLAALRKVLLARQKELQKEKSHV